MDEFIDSIPDVQRQKDARQILEMMEEVTGEKAKMWGPSIVDLVDTHLKYESGRELDWFKIGFSPRKGSLTLYGLNGGIAKDTGVLEKLGKCTISKGCLYIKKLADVDQQVLKQLIQQVV